MEKYSDININTLKSWWAYYTSNEEIEEFLNIVESLKNIVKKHGFDKKPIFFNVDLPECEFIRDELSILEEKERELTCKKLWAKMERDLKNVLSTSKKLEDLLSENPHLSLCKELKNSGDRKRTICIALNCLSLSGRTRFALNVYMRGLNNVYTRELGKQSSNKNKSEEVYNDFTDALKDLGYASGRFYKDTGIYFYKHISGEFEARKFRDTKVFRHKIYMSQVNGLGSLHGIS